MRRQLLIRVKGPNDIPAEPHYQVFVYKTETVSEDSYGSYDTRQVESFEQYATNDIPEL
jgi:hypothetical protein